VIGEKAIPAILTYVLFSVIGVAWLFNPDLMFKITKFISKRTLHISKKRAIIFIILYILTAVVLSFL
ncbi:MAG: hypothetical protein QXU40_01600, partial [Candidatus Pacearchaeota archaeon]